MPKSVLFISYDGLTDPLGQSQILPYLKGLAKAGYHITILSCEKSGNFEKNRIEISKSLNGFTIKWAPIYYHKKPPVFSTVYDVWQLQQKARQLHRIENFDLVHTRAGVPALIGLWMKKRYGIKFLNDIREFYAESRVDGKIWNLNNFIFRRIYHFFLKKEKEETTLSDGIVCLTNAAEKIIKQWPEYNPAVPLKVIPCSVDLNLFHPGNIDNIQMYKLKNELKIQDEDFVISYLGSVGSWYLINEMMQFFKIISDQVLLAKFLFICPDAHHTLRQLANSNGISEEKILIRKAKRNEIPALLSLSKYSVFFIKPCYSKQSSSPTKHGEIMAMGVPVITNDGVGDVSTIVEQYDSGIILKELSVKEFENAATKIKEGEAFVMQNIRKGAIEYYNLDKAIMSYTELYKQIIGSS